MYNKVLGKSSSICWFSFTKPCVKPMLNYAKQTKGLNLLADWRGKIEMVGSCVIKTSVGRHSRPIGRPTISRHVDRRLLHMILVFKMASFHCFVNWLSNFLLLSLNFYWTLFWGKFDSLILQFLISVQFVKFALELIRMSLMATSVNGIESKKYWWFRNGKESP